MIDENEHDFSAVTGDALQKILSALANPHRLRIIAALSRERNYVSQLAREIGLSRPLLHMHLRLLESAGLVTGTLELSDDGKAMKYYEVTPFMLHITPERIVDAARTLGKTTRDSEGESEDEQ